MLLLKSLILFALLLVFIQDLKYRAVYWYLFPLLILLFVLIPIIQHRPLADYSLQTLVNVSFLLMQLLLVSLYFTIKHRAWVNITKHLLGWGDILLLCCVAFYLPPLSFMAFYMGSLIIVLLIWLIWKLLNRNQTQIPLAGLQALFLFVLIAVNIILPACDATDDFWLTRFLLTI